MGQLTLDTPVQYVKGVGPRRAEQLAQLGVRTVEDLLMYFPRRFDLRRQAQSIASLTGEEPSATVAGEVISVEQSRHARKPWFACCIEDSTGWVIVKWFHGGYLRETIKPGINLAVSGKVSVYRQNIQLINPSHQVLWDPEGTNLSADELLPVYPAGSALTSGQIGLLIRRVVPQVIDLVPQWFDESTLKNRGLMDRRSAIKAMHRPQDTRQWALARKTLAYGECLILQLGLASRRAQQQSRPAHALRLTAKIDQRIRARFPFSLTDAQNRAVGQIAADLGRDSPMNRLLQGDVGSGKTVVALYAALLSVANGKQVAIMAPTEILARQHFEKIESYLSGSKVRTDVLVGDQPAKTRNRILDALAGGSIDIVVGTHALLGQQVHFADLAMVIVDEQHKFGVRQRTGIRSKGFAPHYLVMTATPIPRTLAMTVFGDLDVSVIDALPPGRGTTATRLASLEQMPKIIELVESKLLAGQHAYFIYPLVQQNEQIRLRSAQQASKELANGPLGRFGVGLIHGQMTSQKKQVVMEDFRHGRIKVLAASVVVEVGLDVPDANVMVVMHAERFGLAQLHQMRGRIGRSSKDALCILVGSAGNPIARQRLDVLVKSNDGFHIAEQDLRLRGPGEFLGTRQHGLPELKVADLADDLPLLQQARQDAVAIIAADPMLEAPHNQILREAMLKAYEGKFSFAGIA